MELLLFLDKVPSAAWGLLGAVVGAMGALVATWISNRGSDKRFKQQVMSDELKLKTQLAHDAEQKYRDRNAELRRSVYLSGAEAFVGINSYLGGLASVDPTNMESLTNNLNDFFKATARMQIVATEKTRKSVAEISNIYGGLFLELLSAASESHSIKIEMNVNRQSQQHLQLEADRVLAAMRLSNETLDSKYRFEALSDSHKRLMETIGQLNSEFNALSDRHQDELERYGLLSTKKLSELAEIQAEATAFIREELELDGNQENIKEQLEVQKSAANKAGADFFSNLRKMRERDRSEGDVSEKGLD